MVGFSRKNMPLTYRGNRAELTRLRFPPHGHVFSVGDTFTAGCNPLKYRMELL